MQQLDNVLIHGFNVNDPSKSIGKLAKYVKKPVMFTYGWRGLLGVIFTNKKVATDLVKAVHGNVVNIVAHSNGAAVAVEALKQGLKVDTMVLITPALKVDTVFPKSVKRIFVIYTKHDVPTRAARILDMIPFIQVFIPNAWGAMGAKGPYLYDERVVKIEANQYEGHSEMFSKEHIKELGDVVGALTETE